MSNLLLRLPLLLLLLLLHSAAASCPQECECSPNQEVSCSGRTLTYIPESSDRTNVFTALDLSKNNLMDLSADSFTSFPRLQRIDLRYNYIRNIYAMTFDSLSDLKIVQLEFNYLESVYPLAFQFNPLLSNLYLSGNPVDLSASLPLSDSIKHLDLTRCRLKTLPADVFADYTQLEVLNLNHNMLETLPQDFFQTLPKLKQVYLHGNLWRCGEEAGEVMRRWRHLIGDAEKLQCTTQDKQQRLLFPEVTSTTEQPGNITATRASGGNVCLTNQMLLSLPATITLVSLLRHTSNFRT